jgi:plastocyanin
MNHMARTLFALVLVCSLGISAMAPIAWAAGTPGAVKPAAPRSITLHGSSTGGWGFAANSITQPGPPIEVDQGDVITFTLFAADSIDHNLVIDLNSDNGQDTNEPFSPTFSSATSSISWEYTANTAGTFRYICGLHLGAVMGGSFTVRSAGVDNTLLIVGGVVGVIAVVGIAVAAMRMRRKSKPPMQPPTS